MQDSDSAEFDPEEFPDVMMDLDTIFEGCAEVEISNAGGEIFELVKEALGKKKRLVNSFHFEAAMLSYLISAKIIEHVQIGQNVGATASRRKSRE